MSKSKKESMGKTGESDSPSRDAAFYIKILKDPMAVADLYARPEDRDLCEPLVRALEDPDDLTRRAAVKALVMLDDLYAASSRYGVVTHGSIPARRASVEVLGRIGTGDPLAVTHLFNALSDSDPSVRECAAEALENLGIPVKKNSDSS